MTEVQAQILAKTTLEKEIRSSGKAVFQENAEALFQDPMNIPDLEDANI